MRLLGECCKFSVLMLLALACSCPLPASAAAFDFPLGKPDGVGYGVRGLGGLDFLDLYDYGGTCGWVPHPGEDWNADGTGRDVGGDGNDAGDPVYATADGKV